MIGSAPDASTARPLRVMIADDDPDVRTALLDLICDDANLEIVGAAEDADGAVLLASRQHPDVAVLDVRMPGGGVFAAREIHRLCPEAVVIGLSSHSDRHTVDAMLAAGASRFLVKGAPDSDLLATIAEFARSLPVATPPAARR